VREEVGVEASGLTKVGELSFQFVDGYALHGTVFFASTHSGTPHATREADPFWCPVDEIPYERMWEDDRYWLPSRSKGSRSGPSSPSTETGCSAGGSTSTEGGLGGRREGRSRPCGERAVRA
jgi:hypothetical protein